MSVTASGGPVIAKGGAHNRDVGVAGVMSGQVNREVDLGSSGVCARVRSVVGIQITFTEVKGAGRCIVGRVDFCN